LHISGVTSDDHVFKALADGSRRLILDRLRDEGGLALGQLCDGHDMTRQAVSKHLAILEAAGLVVSVRRGRQKLHFLNPVPIHDIAMRWIGRFQTDHLAALHRLKQALEGDQP
jgi:DNA-binding transcriptional ArsR family regulator